MVPFSGFNQPRIIPNAKMVFMINLSISCLELNLIPTQLKDIEAKHAAEGTKPAAKQHIFRRKTSIVIIVIC